VNMGIAIDRLAEQNATMRHALDVIREHEFLRDSLAAKGIALNEPPISMAAITEIVAARHSCSVAELRGHGRTRCIAWPRQEAMWQIRQVRAPDGSPRFSLPQIGRYFSDRDHTTVLHAVKAHAKRSLAQQEAA
jgi:chromosomal replication initiator protein